MVTLPEVDNWIDLDGTAPPAVGLMADAGLQRNLEIPGDVRGSAGTMNDDPKKKF